MKIYKKSIMLMMSLIVLSSLCFGCNVQSNGQKRRHVQSNNDFVDKDNIESFKIHNMKAERVEVKDKVERDKIIDLINSVKIQKTGVEPRDGVGFGVEIIYSNGEKFTASYLADTMVYSANNSKAAWCDIDKSVFNDLMIFYDKTDIASFKIYNLKAEGKETKNKEDRDRVIELMHSVNVTKAGVETPLGMGFGIEIGYSNGKKLKVNFTENTMTSDGYPTNKIDKNIISDLRYYYDKN